MLSWQKALSELITDPLELCHLLEIDPKLVDLSDQAIQQFPLRVSRSFVSRMQKGNIRDPLLLQVLPVAQEMKQVTGFTPDPLHEKDANPLPGLLHKYKGRVLFTLTGACAINCRPCFRRHFPYAENMPNKAGWEKVIHYIQADESIAEIILSGGDPLTIKDEGLQQLITYLEKIPHLSRLRIHTRLPVVIPERVTDELIRMLTESRLQSVVVIHCNHPNEIDSSVITAMKRLRNHGITLLNQSMLMRGVNDDVAILKKLSEKLFAMGVLPYYLHLLDPVAGAAHFWVEEPHAKEMIWQLAQQLPGYLVPKLVQEVPGQPAKMTML